VGVKEQYQVKISNRLAALQNFVVVAAAAVDDDVDIKRPWESIRESKSLQPQSRGYYELKQQKLCVC
jgi:hypothetical protein